MSEEINTAVNESTNQITQDTEETVVQTDNPEVCADKSPETDNTACQDTVQADAGTDTTGTSESNAAEQFADAVWNKMNSIISDTLDFLRKPVCIHILYGIGMLFMAFLVPLIIGSNIDLLAHYKELRILEHSLERSALIIAFLPVFILLILIGLLHMSDLSRESSASKRVKALVALPFYITAIVSGIFIGASLVALIPGVNLPSLVISDNIWWRIILVVLFSLGSFFILIGAYFDNVSIKLRVSKVIFTSGLLVALIALLAMCPSIYKFCVNTDKPVINVTEYKTYKYFRYNDSDYIIACSAGKGYVLEKAVISENDNEQNITIYPEDQILLDESIKSYTVTTFDNVTIVSGSAHTTASNP